MMRIIKLFIACILVLNTNISVFAEDANKIIVARVNDAPITLEELNNAVVSHNDRVDRCELAVNEQGKVIEVTMDYAGKLSLAPKIITREQKLIFLKDEVITSTLLYQEALKRGLDKNIETKNISLNEKREILINQVLQQEVSDLKVSAEEIEDSYDFLLKEQQRKGETAPPLSIIKQDIESELASLKKENRIADLKTKLASGGAIEIYEDKIN